ncbi:MAG: glycosyltransferase [Planctomycetota bacterium]
MIRNRNIICIASSWFDHPTSKHHVMRLLSQHNDVIWVNYHASRRPTVSTCDARAIVQRLRRAWGRTQWVLPRLEVLSPLLLPLPEARLVREFNTRILLGQLKQALHQRPRRPLQLWLFTPDAPELIEHLPTERVVYYCVDDFAAFQGFNRALIEDLEKRTVAASDIVIATSPELFATRRQEHPNTHLLPHGVDFEHFAAALDPATRVPEELNKIPRPILGYLGLISDYVDLDLLAAAARRKPEWSFVLIGDQRCSCKVLHGLRNVYLLGGKPYKTLPAYCRGFDVGLIPFRLNRLTRAVNPIKLREYLAAGLPVVSTPLSSVMPYVPAVRPAATVDEFLAACADALADEPGAPPERQELVRGESWQCRVMELSDLVMSTYRESGKRAKAVVTVGSAT